MKKYPIVLTGMLMAGILSSFSVTTNLPKKGTPIVATQQKPAAASKADIEKGKALIGKSDCLACHKIEEKLVGPAYKDVAKKYKPTKANIDLLAGKIVKGGTGVWGQIPMSPHPQVPVEDAKKMVVYILSLNAAK